ncbi:MAG: hypothetical protein QM764_24525 [Chitinophagaceae bacterium]
MELTQALPHKQNLLKEKVQLYLPSYNGILIGWLIIFLMMRVGEIVINGITHQFPAKTFFVLLISIATELFFVCKAGVVLFPLFFL